MSNLDFDPKYYNPLTQTIIGYLAVPMVGLDVVSKYYVPTP